MELTNELPKEVVDYPVTAMALTVTDQTTYGAAGDAVKTLKNFKKQITDFFGPMKKKAHEAHKEISTKEKEALAPLVEAESLVRLRMNTFLQEQERKRREQERKELLAAQLKAKKEKEALEKRALAAMESGKEEKAEDLIEQAEDVYAAPISTPAAVAPIRTGETLTTMADKLAVEVTDLPAFLKALVEGGSACTMVKIGQRELTAWAKANAIDRFPGLRIEKTKVAVIR